MNFEMIPFINVASNIQIDRDSYRTFIEKIDAKADTKPFWCFLQQAIYPENDFQSLHWLYTFGFILQDEKQDHLLFHIKKPRKPFHAEKFDHNTPIILNKKGAAENSQHCFPVRFIPLTDQLSSIIDVHLTRQNLYFHTHLPIYEPVFYGVKQTYIVKSGNQFNERFSKVVSYLEHWYCYRTAIGMKIIGFTEKDNFDLNKLKSIRSMLTDFDTFSWDISR